MGAGVEAIEHDGTGCVVVAGARRIDAELVVMGAGVAPRSELALCAGVALADDGAIPVDARMQTAVAGLLAAGDVARAVSYRKELQATTSQVLGTMVVERILDFLSLLFVFFVALMGVPEGRGDRQAAFTPWQGEP